MDLRPPRSGVSHPVRSTRPCTVRRWSRGSIGNPEEPGACASLACRPRDFRVRTRDKRRRCRHWPSSRVKQPVHSARPRGPEPNRGPIPMRRRPARPDISSRGHDRYASSRAHPQPFGRQTARVLRAGTSADTCPKTSSDRPDTHAAYSRRQQDCGARASGSGPAVCRTRG